MANSLEKRSSVGYSLYENLPDSEFAYVKYSGATADRRFPILSPDDVHGAVVGLSEVTDIGPLDKKEAAEKIQRMLTGDTGERVKAMLAQQDLDTLEDLAHPGELTGANQGDVELTGPNLSGETTGDAEGLSEGKDILVSESEGPVLVKVPIEGLGGDICICSEEDAEKVSQWLQKHAETLSDKDKRAGAMSVRVSYEALGYDFDNPKDVAKSSAVVAEYSGLDERLGAREALQRDRLNKIRDLKMKMKTPDSVESAKKAYTALFTGTLEVEDLGSKLTQLDEVLGVYGHIPAYGTLFRHASERRSDLDMIFGDSPEDEVLSVGNKRIKVRDLKKVKYMNLARIQRWLGAERTNELKEDPLGTFNQMDRIEKKAIIDWVFSRTRGAEKDQGLV